MSLRDVERAMIVFEYFYNKKSVFRSEIDKLKAKEKTATEKV